MLGFPFNLNTHGRWKVEGVWRGKEVGQCMKFQISYNKSGVARSVFICTIQDEWLRRA